MGGPPSDPGTSDPGTSDGADPGTALVLAQPGCPQADGACQLRSASEQVDRSLRAVIRWARRLRSTPPAPAAGNTRVHGPLAVEAPRGSAAERVEMRLTLEAPDAGSVAWALEVRPASAPASGYRLVFSGRTAIEGERRSGAYAIDLGVLGGATGGAAIGRCVGTFLRQPDRASTDVVLSGGAGTVHLRAQATPDGVRSQLVGEETAAATP